MAHGYYYALGLFLSTLFGAIITTHFNYQVETHTAISFLHAAYSYRQLSISTRVELWP